MMVDFLWSNMSDEMESFEKLYKLIDEALPWSV